MTFEAELADALGAGGDAYDIRAVVRRCYFYDFDGYPVRLWHGQGRLFAGGQEWLGTIDAGGTDHHQVPALQDGRDGASPRYQFGIPYLDRDTYLALKADQDRAKGRNLTIYRVICLPGEGMRPLTALRFSRRLLMQGVQFSEALEGDMANPVRRYSASVLVASLEYGRTRIPNGTYTDTAQRERSRLLGVASDSGCSFVAANSRRTYVVGG